LVNKPLQQSATAAIDPETIERIQQAAGLADRESIERIKRAVGLADRESIERIKRAASLAVDPKMLEEVRRAASLAVDPKMLEEVRRAASLAVDPEMLEGIRRAASLAVDPAALERARVSLLIPLGQLRSVVNAAVGAVEPDRSEPLLCFAGGLLDAEAPEADLVPEWVRKIGTARQWTLFVLGLAALAAVADASGAEGDVPHLSVIVNALVAMVIFLNAVIDTAGQ
jgi:hypothetical protein